MRKAPKPKLDKEFAPLPFLSVTGKDVDLAENVHNALQSVDEWNIATIRLG
jgi:hypothetical protein